MRNKISDSVIGGFFVVALLLGVSAQGAGTGTVSATVTVQNVSVTITTDGSIPYGTLAASATTNTLSTGLNDTQLARNNGNVTSSLNILGSSTTPGNWTLNSSAGTDQFVHKFSTTSAFGGAALTTSYQTVSSTFGVSTTSTLDFQFTAPSSVTDYTQQSFSVTIQAAAI